MKKLLRLLIALFAIIAFNGNALCAGLHSGHGADKKGVEDSVLCTMTPKADYAKGDDGGFATLSGASQKGSFIECGCKGGQGKADGHLPPVRVYDEGKMCVHNSGEVPDKGCSAERRGESPPDLPPEKDMGL